jgi:hypothetical protein
LVFCANVFCVRGGISPLSWEYPKAVYRGATFSLDILADYARRPGELIRWQGFASSSVDEQEAGRFGNNVLIELLLLHSVPSLAPVSVFKREQEFMLTPYQWFVISDVRWDSANGRWILSLAEEKDLVDVPSWFVKVEGITESE